MCIREQRQRASFIVLYEAQRHLLFSMQPSPPHLKQCVSDCIALPANDSTGTSRSQSWGGVKAYPVEHAALLPRLSRRCLLPLTLGRLRDGARRLLFAALLPRNHFVAL
jgi:hypothetical protein